MGHYSRIKINLRSSGCTDIFCTECSYGIPLPPSSSPSSSNCLISCRTQMLSFIKGTGSTLYQCLLCTLINPNIKFKILKFSHFPRKMGHNLTGKQRSIAQLIKLISNSLKPSLGNQPAWKDSSAVSCSLSIQRLTWTEWIEKGNTAYSTIPVSLPLPSNFLPLSVNVGPISNAANHWNQH